MNILKYIFPNEVGLWIAIGLIWVIALIVSHLCQQLKKRINANISLLDQTNEKGVYDISYLQQTMKYSEIDYNTCFANYCKNRDFNEETQHIFEHLKTIYVAGCQSSHLDSALLIENTVNKITKGSSTIKTCISLFLVCGILGTLLGLSFSVGELASALGPIMEGKKVDIHPFSSHLAGAFIPSMWGVAFTIGFVFYFTFYIEEKNIDKLVEKLTSVTIDVWIPVLYPTNFQKGEISIQKLDDAVQKANIAIKDNTEFTNSAKELQKNVNETNDSVTALRSVANSLIIAANTYTKSSNGIESLNSNLGALREELKQNNAYFNEYLNTQIASLKTVQENSKTEFFEKVQEIQKGFEDQNKILQGIIAKLNQYDQNLFKKQDEFIKGINESVAESLKASRSITGITSDVVNNVQVPLADMNNTLTRQLFDISERLDRGLREAKKPLTTLGQELTDQFDLMIKGLGAFMEAKGGMTKEDFTTLMNSISTSKEPQSYVDTSVIESKLDLIAKRLNELNLNQTHANIDKQEEKIITPYIKLAPLVIAVFLFVGLIMQGIMINKISGITEEQSKTIRVINELKTSQEKLLSSSKEEQNIQQ